MRLLKNPVTYLLIAFTLVVYAPFLIGAILLSLVMLNQAPGVASNSLYILSGIFFLMFMIAAFYVQTLFFSYAQQGARATLLEVFSGARQQFLRVILFDVLVFAALLPGFILVGVNMTNGTLAALFAWTVIVSLAVLTAPRYLAQHSAIMSIRKSVVSFHNNSVLAAKVLAIISVLATLFIFSAQNNSGLVLQVASTFTTLLLATVTFIPMLLMKSSLELHLGITVVLRAISAIGVLYALHIICATSQKSGLKGSVVSARK